MIDWVMIGCKEPDYIVAVELWGLTGVGTCCYVTSNWFAVEISATGQIPRGYKYVEQRCHKHSLAKGQATRDFSFENMTNNCTASNRETALCGNLSICIKSHQHGG